MQHVQNKRVVITGIGLVCPLGYTTDQVWHAACAGQSGITRLSLPAPYDAYPVTIAGQCGDISVPLSTLLSPREQGRTARFIHLALMAAQQAVEQAQFAQCALEKVGVYCGVGFGGLSDIEEAVIQVDRRGTRAVSPYLVPKATSNQAAGMISKQWGFTGPSLTYNTACSSGSDAIGAAFQAIASGREQYALAGGAESTITPLAITGFGNMRALSRFTGNPAQASRPFDATRDGFVLSEGAGIIALQSLESALAAGTPIIAELVGYGAAADAYHATAPHPQGAGGIAALRAALRDAQIGPEKVGYINAHGTSTSLNDAIETIIIKTVLGERAYTTPISSTKSMTGHMLGAAGGVEAALTALTLQHQIAPPTINLTTPDPRCDLDYVAQSARQIDAQYAVSESFGFGGCSSALVLKRYS